MTPAKARDDLEMLKATVRFQRALILAGAALAILLALAIFVTVGRVRTTLTPPVISKSFWVDDYKVSGSYLEMMGEFVAHQILDVTPDNIDYKKQVLLRWVTPDNHGALKTRMELDKDRLKRDAATLMFWPKQITPFEDRFQVALAGALATYINGAKVAEVDRTYLATFRYQGGRLLLAAFTEVSADDPFALKTASR